MAGAAGGRAQGQGGMDSLALVSATGQPDRRASGGRAQGQGGIDSLALVAGGRAQGQGGMDSLALVSATGQPDLRASQQSVGSAASDSTNVASSAQLHKQLLAAEVAKVSMPANPRSPRARTQPISWR